jgi:hypothetical protein
MRRNAPLEIHASNCWGSGPISFPSCLCSITADDIYVYILCYPHAFYQNEMEEALIAQSNTIVNGIRPSI